VATRAAEVLEIRTIEAELLTAETFAPFGEILSPDGRERLPIDLYGGTKHVYRAAPIDTDRPVEFLVTRSMLREFQVLFLERHLELTQAFIPLGGAPFISVVARADAPEDDGMPKLDELHAFIVPGDVGIQLHRGVWHEPPFPLVDGSLQLVTSHQSLTKGLGSDLNERGEIREADVEKRNMLERAGFIVEIRLPQRR
jgi:ureidoglycolate lyase